MENDSSDRKFTDDLAPNILIGSTIVSIPLSSVVDRIPDWIPIGFGIAAFGSIIISAVIENNQNH